MLHTTQIKIIEKKKKKFHLFLAGPPGRPKPQILREALGKEKKKKKNGESHIFGQRRPIKIFFFTFEKKKLSQTQVLINVPIYGHLVANRLNFRKI